MPTRRRTQDEAPGELPTELFVATDRASGPNVADLQHQRIGGPELHHVPTADVGIAKEFYGAKLGFHVDHDTTIGDGQRIVQLTPPGSGCSIVIGEGVVPPMPPGSIKGLQLVVADITAAHAELVARGVAVSDVTVLGESPSPTPHPLDNIGFVFFDDPDGNSWAVQQISSRATDAGMPIGGRDVG